MGNCQGKNVENVEWRLTLRVVARVVNSSWSLFLHGSFLPLSQLAAFPRKWLACWLLGVGGELCLIISRLSVRQCGRSPHYCCVARALKCACSCRRLLLVCLVCSYPLLLPYFVFLILLFPLYLALTLACCILVCHQQLAHPHRVSSRISRGAWQH